MASVGRGKHQRTVIDTRTDLPNKVAGAYQDGFVAATPRTSWSCHQIRSTVVIGSALKHIRKQQQYLGRKRADYIPSSISHLACCWKFIAAHLHNKSHGGLEEHFRSLLRLPF
jgi:hypothetical protein